MSHLLIITSSLQRKKPAKTVLGQKPPRQKPPRQKPPGQKPPRENL